MERFDKIPYEDLSPESTWTRLGKGSFGCVFKAEYLGIEVAVKEVLASNEYDVSKYFEREVSILSSARHPNIVQYMGLSLAPPTSSSPHQRILIISEYLPAGNLRRYIAGKQPMPWRLRISFAIDIARAMAYLHARQCLHRDLKGENVLLTENERCKVCDFGFARIAAQNEDEMKRMSYCGTDGYMSPEILMGDPFSLPSDIFSFGVILVELLTRKLVSSKQFARRLPSFTISEPEVAAAVSPHCPAGLLKLTFSCLQADPEERPKIKQVLASLQEIEAEIVINEKKGIGIDLDPLSQFGTWNVGSISFSGTRKLGHQKRPSLAPRLPSFEGKVDIPRSSTILAKENDGLGDGESEDDDLAALRRCDITIEQQSVFTAREEYSTSVVVGVRRSSLFASTPLLDESERMDEGETSMLTIRAPLRNKNQTYSSLPSLPDSWLIKKDDKDLSPVQTLEEATMRSSFMTAQTPSTVAATVGIASTLDIFPTPPAASAVFEFDFAEPITAQPAERMHRFSIVKAQYQRLFSRLSSGLILSGGKEKDVHFGPVAKGHGRMDSGDWAIGCQVCEKKVGFVRPFLECDDCGFKCHIKCSDASPPDCGLSTPAQPPTTTSIGISANAKPMPSKLRKRCQPIVA